MRKFRYWMLPAVASVVLISSCGGGGSSACVNDESSNAGKLCIVGPSTGLTIEASGLEPGSDILTTTGPTGKQRTIGPETGRIDGEIGFVGDFSGESVKISGIWNSGEAFEVDIAISN